MKAYLRIFIALIFLLILSKKSYSNLGCHCLNVPIIKTPITIECTKIGITFERCYDFPSNNQELVIYLKPNGLPQQYLASITVPPVNQGSPRTFSYQITNLNPGTTYEIEAFYMSCPNLKVKVNVTTKNFSSTCPNPICNAATNIGCGSFRARWTNRTCYSKTYLTIYNSTTNTVIHNRIEVNSSQNSMLLSGLQAGVYQYFIEAIFLQNCDGVSTSKLVESNWITVPISNSPPNGGPDKVANCVSGSGVYLSATGIGTWSLAEPNSSPSCYFDNNPNAKTSTNPNASFWIAPGLQSILLKWTNSCGVDYVRVYSSNAPGNCGTKTNPVLIRDIRDSKDYNTIYLNNKCWHAQNLNHGAMIPFHGTNSSLTVEPAWPANSNSPIKKYCYLNQEANCTKNGGLYLGDFARFANACPPCWHVATYAEWNGLINSSGTNIATRVNNLMQNNASSNGFKGYVPNSNNEWLSASFANICSYQSAQNVGISGVNIFYGNFDYSPVEQSTLFWSSSPPLLSLGSFAFDNVAPSWLTKYNGTKGGWGLYIQFWGSSNFYYDIFQHNFTLRDIALPIRCVKN